MISIYGFKRVLICFLIISVNYTVWAQDKPTSGDTLKKLINATFANEIAKLFVHYDKTVYLPNETIWFTAYLLNNDTLTNKADILSVALVKNSDRTIAIQKKFVITGAGSSGSILIPDTILAGDYSIIAYTNHFVKGRPEALFIQRIAIKRLEQPDPKVQPKPAQRPALTRADSAKISIKFYPEGGDMVANLPQYVGWEAKDGTGALLKLNAVLLKDEDVIDTISTSAYGLGKFFINPKPGSRYAVKVICAENQSLFNLPLANEKGITLTMSSAMVHDTLVFKVAGTLIGKIHIAVHNNRQTFYVLTDIDLQKQNTFKITLDSLPRGLAAITIYNENLRPCAERIFFAHYDHSPQISIKTTAQKYGKRQKVSFQLGLNSDYATQALISVACVQANRIDKRYFNDIENYGYLDQNLNAFPASLNRDGRMAERKKYLENVLLIRGWRRYTDNAAPYAVPVDSVPRFHGFITVHDKQPRKPMILTLMGSPGVFFINTDKLGNFTIPGDGLITPDNKPLALFATGEISYNTRIKLTDPFDKINRYIAANVQVASEPAQTGEKYNELPSSVMQSQVLLKEVKIKGARGPLYRTEPTPGMHTNACGDYVGWCGALNCRWHTERTSSPLQGHVYYRHGPLKDGWIQYNTPFVYSGCETKNQSLIRFEGINLNKEYYPYSETDINNAEPLYNSTLYWNPQIKLTNDKPTEFSFYTGDISENFIVIVQGVTANGVVYDEEKFEVLK
ncbi:hypothetical protein [Mucilaginibacter sp.]|uniref:hypothetical protein n=1 Tax=Mucilaginibacter sp. TaxID=1882438 RepID=UPI0025F0349B|nr:hypothetical protein [Mucilaginibacter sp.]